MKGLVVGAPPVPALLQVAGTSAETRFWEFFVSNVRNPNRRRAYGRAIGEFFAWCERRGVASNAEVEPLHVGAYVEALSLG